MPELPCSRFHRVLIAARVVVFPDPAGPTRTVTVRPEVVAWNRAAAWSGASGGRPRPWRWVAGPFGWTVAGRRGERGVLVQARPGAGGRAGEQLGLGVEEQGAGVAARHRLPPRVRRLVESRGQGVEVGLVDGQVLGEAIGGAHQLVVAAVEGDTRAGGYCHEAVMKTVAFGGGRHRTVFGDPGDLGFEVPPVPRRPPGLDPRDSQPGQLTGRVGPDVTREERAPVLPRQGGREQVAGLTPGELAGALGPGGEQVRPRVGPLDRAGGQGRPLAQPDRLDPGRAAAVGGVEVRDQGAQRRRDVAGPGREHREELVVDAVDLERRRAPRAAVAPPERHRQPPRQLIGEQRVVGLRHGHRGGEQDLAVQGPPRPVGALDPVGEHDVGVQVRVPVPGVGVVERRRDHPTGARPGWRRRGRPWSLRPWSPAIRGSGRRRRRARPGPPHGSGRRPGPTGR